MSENLFATIYDNVMKLLVQHRITPDGLEAEISKMKMMFGPYYPDDNLDQEELLRQILFDFGVFEGTAKAAELWKKSQEAAEKETARLGRGIGTCRVLLFDFLEALCGEKEESR